MRALSRVQLFVAPWTVVHQAPLSMGLFRQEYWSRLAFPTPRDLPDPGIKPHLLCLLAWPAGSSPLAPPRKPLKKESFPFFPSHIMEGFNWETLRVFPVQVRERELNQTGFFCYPSPGSETLASRTSLYSPWPRRSPCSSQKCLCWGLGRAPHLVQQTVTGTRARLADSTWAWRPSLRSYALL